MVLGYHSRPMLDKSSWWERLWCQLFDSGWYGVDLFFVLSGYLITGILLDTLGRRAYFRSFAMRRVLRIFPLYYAVLFGLLIVIPFILDWGHIVGISKPRLDEQIWYWLYAHNWIAVFVENPPQWHILIHLWSLAVEEQFYLVWPFVVFLFRGRSLDSLCWCLVLGCLVARFWARYEQLDTGWIYGLSVFRIDSLAIGALAASSVKSAAISPWLDRWAPRGALLVIAALLTLACTGVPIDHQAYWPQTIGFTALALGFASLVLAVHDRRRTVLALAFERPWLCYLGKRSYAIYVLHIPIFTVLYGVYVSMLARTDRGGRDLLTTSVAFLFVIIAAEISWHVYEKQFLKLKKYFPRASDSSTPSAAALTRCEIQL